MDFTTCIFCKIILGIIPSTIVYQDHTLIVIKDIQPRAPIHYLIIPKKHIAQMSEASIEDQPLLASLLLASQELAKTLPFPQDYRLLINNGATVGQTVFHVHIHFLAGKSFQE